MYSGTTLRNQSGNTFGTHQRIDKIARKHLSELLKHGQKFPDAKSILYFEGNNGPDGVKRKSPSVDEPWHYLDPKKPNDRSMIQMITDHQHNLTKALEDDNNERAAFEAAWLAHAIVDGLTPAHHFPLADKIEELFGMPHYERLSVKQKNLIRGSNRRDTVSKNWQYWGSRGIFATHFMFEFGVSAIIFGKKFTSTVSDNDIAQLTLQGYEVVFQNIIQQIADLNIYEDFTRRGWNLRLARRVQFKLLPLIIKAVVLGWYTSVRAVK